MSGLHKLGNTKKKLTRRSNILLMIYSFASLFVGNMLTFTPCSVSQEFAADLKSYISTMLSNLQNVGVEVNVNI